MKVRKLFRLQFPVCARKQQIAETIFVSRFFCLVSTTSAVCVRKRRDIQENRQSFSTTVSSPFAGTRVTHLRDFKLLHFSATAVIKETVRGQPLRFIDNTDDEILSIRVTVLSAVRFKPRRSASLHSEWSCAIRRHCVHTIEARPRSLKENK